MSFSKENLISLAISKLTKSNILIFYFYAMKYSYARNIDLCITCKNFVYKKFS